MRVFLVAGILSVLPLWAGCSKAESGTGKKRPKAAEHEARIAPRRLQRQPVDRAALKKCRSEENLRGKGVSVIGWTGAHKWDKMKKVHLVYLKATSGSEIPLFTKPFVKDPTRGVVAKLKSELVTRRLKAKIGPKRCWYKVETPDGQVGWISNEHVVGQGGWRSGACGG